MLIMGTDTILVVGDPPSPSPTQTTCFELYFDERAFLIWPERSSNKNFFYILSLYSLGLESFGT